MDARRFEDWEFPYALVLGSKAAIDYALALGLDQITERNKFLCNRVRTGLKSLGLRLLDIGAKQSSIITVEIPNRTAPDVLAALRKENINTSVGHRNFALIDFEAKQVDWALRISPHCFNTQEEVDILVGAVKKIVS
jgi:selenocysteine lyase/cysteine desulfurase